MAKLVNNYKPSSLPTGWEEKVSPEGRVYYLDHSTKETQWHHPITRKRKRVVAGLPPGWAQIEEKNGQTLFINKTKNITTDLDPRLPLVLEEKEYHEDTNPTEVVPYPFQLQMMSYNLSVGNPYLLNQLLPNPFAKVSVLPSLPPPGNNIKIPSDIKGLPNNNTSMFPTLPGKGFGNLSSGSIPSLMSMNCSDLVNKGLGPATDPAKGSLPDKSIVNPHSRFGTVGNNQLGRTRRSRFDSGPFPSNNQPDKGEFSSAPTSRFDAGLEDEGAGSRFDSDLNRSIQPGSGFKDSTYPNSRFNTGSHDEGTENVSNRYSRFGPQLGERNRSDKDFRYESDRNPISRFVPGPPGIINKPNKSFNVESDSKPYSRFDHQEEGRFNPPDRNLQDKYSTNPHSRLGPGLQGMSNKPNNSFNVESDSNPYSRFNHQEEGRFNPPDRNLQDKYSTNPQSRLGPGLQGMSNKPNNSFNVESDSNPYSRFNHQEEGRFNPPDRNLQDKYSTNPQSRLGPGLQGMNNPLDRDFNNEFGSKPYSRFDTHEEERNNPIGRGLLNESGLDRPSRFGPGLEDRNNSAGRNFNVGPGSSSYSGFDSRERERYTPTGKGGRDNFDSKPYLKFGDREKERSPRGRGERDDFGSSSSYSMLGLQDRGRNTIGRGFRADDFDSQAYSRFGPREGERSNPLGRSSKDEDDSPPSRFGSRIVLDRGLRDEHRSNSKSRIGPSSSDRDFPPGRGFRNESASNPGTRFQYGSIEIEYSPVRQFHDRPEERDSRGSASREYSPQRQGYSNESFEAGRRKRRFDYDPNERGYPLKIRQYDNFNMPDSSEREYDTYDERGNAGPQERYSERLDKSRQIGGRFYSDKDMEREHKMQGTKYSDDEPRDYPQTGSPIDRMNSSDALVGDNQYRNSSENDSENTVASDDSENSDRNEDDEFQDDNDEYDKLQDDNDEYGELQDDDDMVELIIDGPESKKKKKKKPFKKENMVIQKRNVVALVPDGFPRIKSLSRIQAEEAKNLIIKQIELLKPEDGVNPRFAGTFYKVGALMVTCLDNLTRNWLEDIMHQLVMSDGTKLMIRGPRIVRGTAIISGLFPGKYEGEERFLHILTSCNPRLDISRWTVVEQFALKGSTCVSIGTPKSTIWELEQCKYIVYYNERSLKVRVLSKKNSGKRPQRGKLRQALQDALTEARVK